MEVSVAPLFFVPEKNFYLIYLSFFLRYWIPFSFLFHPISISCRKAQQSLKTHIQQLEERITHFWTYEQLTVVEKRTEEDAIMFDLFEENQSYEERHEM